MFEESLLRTVAGFLAPLSSWPTIHRELKVERPPLSDPEHLDPRQRLALQPFEERAAGGRDIGEPPGRAGSIERRDRVTAACHRNNLPGGGEFRRGFGDLDRADVERLELEGAERPVPHQRLDPGEHGADMLDAARAELQHHLPAAHAIHRDRARGRVRRERLAPTASTGNTSSRPLAFALAMISRAVGRRSRSHSDLPTVCPRAARNVLAMPPPMMRVSTFASRLPSRSTLVDTLAPPTIAASGRTGVCSTFVSASSSSCMVRPA